MSGESERAYEPHVWAERAYRVEFGVSGQEPFTVDVLLESADDLLGWLESLPPWVSFYIDKFAINGNRLEAEFPLMVRREAILSVEVKYQTYIKPTHRTLRADHG